MRNSKNYNDNCNNNTFLPIVEEILTYFMWNKNAIECYTNVTKKTAKLFSFHLRLSVASNVIIHL